MKTRVHNLMKVKVEKCSKSHYLVVFAAVTWGAMLFATTCSVASADFSSVAAGLIATPSCQEIVKTRTKTWLMLFHLDISKSHHTVSCFFYLVLMKLDFVTFHFWDIVGLILFLWVFWSFGKKMNGRCERWRKKESVHTFFLEMCLQLD